MIYNDIYHNIINYVPRSVLVVGIKKCRDIGTPYLYSFTFRKACRIFIYMYDLLICNCTYFLIDLRYTGTFMFK